MINTKPESLSQQTGFSDKQPDKQVTDIEGKGGVLSQAPIPSNPNTTSENTLPTLGTPALSAFQPVIPQLGCEIQPVYTAPMPYLPHTSERDEPQNQPVPGLGNPDRLGNSFMEGKEKIPKSNSTPYVLLGLTSVGSAAASAAFFLGGFIAPAWFCGMIASVTLVGGASIGIAKYKARARAIRDSNPAGNNRGQRYNSNSPKKNQENQKNLEMGNSGNSDLVNVNEPNPSFVEASTLVSQTSQDRIVTTQHAQTSPVNFDSPVPNPGLSKLSGQEEPLNKTALAAAAGQSKTR